MSIYSVPLLIIWVGHSERTVREFTPDGIDMPLLMISKGLTGQLQEQVVDGFRMWKQFVRRFLDAIMLPGSGENVHAQDRIVNVVI